jgi:hypothetical protein
MSNVVVGSLSVDLVARTASFQGDLGKAAQSARGSFQDIRSSASAAGAGAEEAGHSFGSMRAQIGLLDNAMRGNLAGGFADITHVISGLAPAFVGMIGPIGAVAGAALLLADVWEHLAGAADKAKESSIKAAEDYLKELNDLYTKADVLREALKSPFEQAADASVKASAGIAVINVQIATLKAHLAELSQQKAGILTDPIAAESQKPKLTQIDADTVATQQQINKLLGQQALLEQQLATETTKATGIEKHNSDAVNESIQKQLELSQKKLQSIKDALYFEALEGKAQQDHFNGEGAGIVGSSNPLDDIVRQTSQDNVLLAKHQDIVIGKVSETYKAYERLGDQIGNTIEQAALFGRSWKDAISSILIDVAELILKMTLLKSIQSSLGATGVGGFFSGLLGGITGGAHADGGTIPPGTIGLTGEAGPELVYGGMTGVTVYPIAKSTTNTNGVTNIYQMDFRGASDDIQAKVQQAIAVSQRQSVAAAVNTMRDQQRRGAR